MLLLETFNMELLEVSSAALFCLICCHQVSNDWLIDWLYRYIFYLVWSDWYNDLSHSFLFSFLVIFQELTDCSANESIGLFDHHQGINPSLNSDDIIQPELIDSVIDTLIACMYQGRLILSSPALDYRSHRCVIQESLLFLHLACHQSLSPTYF